MGRSVDHEAAVEEGGRGRGEWRVSEWKWQEGRKEGWWSIPDYARRTGRGKKDCGRVMDAGAESRDGFTRYAS